MSSWAPHAFRREGEKVGYDSAYLNALVKTGDHLNSGGYRVCFTLKHFSSMCEVPHDFLEETVRRKNEPYRTFDIRKRNGKFRTISVPHPLLFQAQRWIHDNILKKAPKNPEATAFFENTSNVKNAQIHCGAKWLIKIDVEDFFDNISERQVYHVFRNFGYPKLLSFKFARLTTKVSMDGRNRFFSRWQTKAPSRSMRSYWNGQVGCLPQGAPTSPILANLVCASLDKDLAKQSKIHECIYTRYADDIVFSALSMDRPKAKKIVLEINKRLSAMGLRANRRKIHIVPPGARKIVTGLGVDGDRPTLGKEMKDRIKAHLHYAKKFGVAAHCLRKGFRSLIGFRNHLQGLVLYASQVDAEFGKKCVEEMSQIDWPDIEI